MIECLLWLDRVVSETWRLWICIGVKGWFMNWTSTRPETTAAHFVRICFHCYETGHVWCTWMWRRCTSGESGYSQIKCSPEKMYRTNLAYEEGTKFIENPAGFSHDTPDPLRIFRIICCVLLVLFEWSSILYFHRCSPDCYRHSERFKGGHCLLIKISNRPRSKSDCLCRTVSLND